MCHLPRLLKENGFDIVDVETNFKGYQLLANNPYIDNLNGINPEFVFTDNKINYLGKYWDLLAEEYDHVINLLNTLEYGCLAMEDENVYYMNTQVRRNRYGKKNFYDVTTSYSGFPNLCEKYRKGEVYYTEKEEKIVSKWMKKFENKFTVLINLSGTGPHKRFVQAHEVIKNILSKKGDAEIILTGGPDCKQFEVEGDRITSIVGKFPFRQALLIAKHVNCVIGCESGLMVGSTMWETPTIQLMTAASIDNHGKYNPNDYSIQSPCYCSPCHKGPYDYRGCPHKNGNPLCVYFDINEILKKVEVIYRKSVVTA